MSRKIYERDQRNLAVMNRRRNQVRKQKLKALFSVILITLVLSLGFGARLAFANSTKSENNRAKCYKSVEIFRGDTIEHIAGEYMSSEWSSFTSYINEVLVINHMDIDDVLIPGNYIVVPYYVEK